MLPGWQTSNIMPRALALAHSTGGTRVTFNLHFNLQQALSNLLFRCPSSCVLLVKALCTVVKKMTHSFVKHVALLKTR